MTYHKTDVENAENISDAFFEEKGVLSVAAITDPFGDQGHGGSVRRR